MEGSSAIVDTELDQFSSDSNDTRCMLRGQVLPYQVLCRPCSLLPHFPSSMSIVYLSVSSWK